MNKLTPAEIEENRRANMAGLAMSHSGPPCQVCRLVGWGFGIGLALFCVKFMLAPVMVAVGQGIIDFGWADAAALMIDGTKALGLVALSWAAFFASIFCMTLFWTAYRRWRRTKVTPKPST